VETYSMTIQTSAPADTRLAYSIADARYALGGISQPQIYKHINSGELRTYTIGRRRFVSEEALKEFVSRRESATQ